MTGYNTTMKPEIQYPHHNKHTLLMLFRRITVKRSGKIVSVHAMEVYRGSRGRAARCHLGTKRKWMVFATLTLDPPVPTEQEVKEAPERV
jgi:hypothetical protein